MNISMDNWYCNRFIHLGRRIFPVNHSGASLCLQSSLHPARMHDIHVLPCVLVWDFWTPNFCWNYRSKYEIVIEYRCIAMRISTHFVWIKAAQQVFFNVISYNCSEILDLDRIIALPIITHSSRQTCGKDSCQISYVICEFKGLRNRHYR